MKSVIEKILFAVIDLCCIGLYKLDPDATHKDWMAKTERMS